MATSKQIIKCDDKIPEKVKSIPEKCWEEKYRNDSRKWLLEDGFTKHSETQSTMKATFPYKQKITPDIGSRTKILCEKLLREAEREIQEESNQPPVIEEYMTTYDDTFCSQIPGFVVKPVPRAKELYDKYPLYRSVGTTYWHFQLEKNFGNRPLIPGSTKTSNISNPFKRNSNFSKPIKDYLGGTELN